MDAKDVAAAFIDAINRHHVDDILALMSGDHIFVDAYGNRQTRDEMKTGWPGYFAWFPDYRIEVTDMLHSGGTVGVFGYAGGTYGKGDPKAGRWRLPAAWKVVVEGGRVKLWQVFADSKIPCDIMDRGDRDTVDALSPREG